MLLIQIGVPIDMVEWIMGCINSASFVVLMNGSPSSFFRPSRGLRQGCPLSPFMFLLIAKALSRLLNRAREENLIKGVKVTNQTDLTHGLFVDDVLMFGEGTLNNLQNRGEDSKEVPKGHMHGDQSGKIQSNSQ